MSGVADGSRESNARSLVAAALDEEIRRQNDVVSAMNALCHRLGAYLGRWIGAAGWRSILRSAVTGAASETPSALSFGTRTQLRWSGGGGIAEVRDACVEVLVALVGVLGRLVGSEIALRLIEQGVDLEDRAEHEGLEDG